MKDIQNKSDNDLKQYLADTREELRSIRFGASGSGVRNSRAQRNTRKEIARSLTELNRRNREVKVDSK